MRPTFSARPGASTSPEKRRRNSGKALTMAAVAARSTHSLRSSLTCDSEASALRTWTTPPGLTSRDAGVTCSPASATATV